MHGTTEPTVIGETDGDLVNYVFAMGNIGAAFYTVKDSRTVSAYKAYLQVPARVTAGVKQLSVLYDDGEETGVLPPTGAITQRVGWWTTGGQRLNQTPAHKGIYIHDGQKVIIK